MSTTIRFDDPTVEIEPSSSHLASRWATARVTFSAWKEHHKFTLSCIVPVHELGTPAFDHIADDAWAKLIKRAGISHRHVVLSRTT